MNYPIVKLEEDVKRQIERLAQMRADKGHDYSGDSPDTLDNLREFGSLGVAVRIGDKFKRLKSFYLTGVLKCSEEKVEDTWDDLINYALYGRIMYDQERQDVHVCACALKPPKVVPWEGDKKVSLRDYPVRSISEGDEFDLITGERK